jgi:hypothetical protein
MKWMLAGCLCLIATGAMAQGQCVVDDPTDTPLNVRQSPYGRILGALHNGTRVAIRDVVYDNRGRQWAYVIPLGGGREGYVFREYLRC